MLEFARVQWIDTIKVHYLTLCKSLLHCTGYDAYFSQTMWVIEYSKEAVIHVKNMNIWHVRSHVHSRWTFIYYVIDQISKEKS